MELGAYLKSINQTKHNLMRSGEHKPAAYPHFIVRRLLSYSQDSVLLANELNCTPGIDPQLQYEFFLHALPKKNRFARFEKPPAEDTDVALLAEFYHCSSETARKLINTHSPEDLETIRKTYSPGGRVTQMRHE